MKSTIRILAVASPVAIAALAVLSGTASAQDRAKDARGEDLRRADRTLAKGQYAEARSLYDRVLSGGDGTKRRDRTEFKRAFAAAKSGDAEGAKLNYAALADRTKSRRLAGSSRLHQADLSTRTGDHDGAAACMERLATDAPDHPQSGVALSRIRANIEKARARGGKIPPGLLKAESVLAAKAGTGHARGKGRPGARGPGKEPRKGKGGRMGDDSADDDGRGKAGKHGPPPGKGPRKGDEVRDDDGKSKGRPDGRGGKDAPDDGGRGGRKGPRHGDGKPDREKGDGDAGGKKEPPAGHSDRDKGKEKDKDRKKDKDDDAGKQDRDDGKKGKDDPKGPPPGKKKPKGG